MGTYRAVRHAPSIGLLRMALPNRVSCSDTDMPDLPSFPWTAQRDDQLTLCWAFEPNKKLLPMRILVNNPIQRCYLGPVGASRKGTRAWRIGRMTLTL